MSWRSCTSSGSRLDGQLFKQRHSVQISASRSRQTSRKLQEAAWQAEADRRNAAEDEKERQYASMDEGERSAYHLGVLRGLEAAQEQAEGRRRGRSRRRQRLELVDSG